MLEVDQIVQGKVCGFTSFGAFVTLPGGKMGLVHISEVSNTYVKEIKDHLSMGQPVRVKILSISNSGKIALSIKKAIQEEQQDQKSRPSRYPRTRSASVWQGPPEREDPENMSFEDMMARFKKVSDEKITDLKRSGEVKHGGYSRRGRGNS